jgi:hypothetical protein
MQKCSICVLKFGNGKEQHRHTGIPGLTYVRPNYLMPYMKINTNWLQISSMVVRWMSIKDECGETPLLAVCKQTTLQAESNGLTKIRQHVQYI